MTDKANTLRLLKLVATVATIVAAAALTSCAARPDRQTTSSIPDDYRTRHPITLAEVQHNLDVPVATGDRQLKSGTRDLVRGFAQDYAALSAGTITIALPEGSVNAASTHAVKGELRKLLIESGIKSTRIVTTSYQPTDANASAPVRLGFVAITAITDECGQWPTDLNGPTLMNNTNWENFGCASQQNLAAQIANPADLIGPRGTTPIDAQRRAEVIKVYREGTTATATP